MVRPLHSPTPINENDTQLHRAPQKSHKHKLFFPSHRPALEPIMKPLSLLLFSLLLSGADIIFQNFYSDLSCSALVEITASPADVCLPEEATDFVYSLKSSFTGGNYTYLVWMNSTTCSGTAHIRNALVVNQCYSRAGDATIKSWKTTSGAAFTNLTSADTVTVHFSDANCTKLLETRVKINANCTNQYPQRSGVCVPVFDNHGGASGSETVYCGSDRAVQNIGGITKTGEADRLHSLPMIFYLGVALLLLL
ncbi:hypothetical protein PROFUN_15431 [Planoprotostelium fungivorum]|uniref:Uncharacterized protein n=1 Tax=Planoprotostelium fungivorum TaxID=1890364 RepID=A0A2P6MWQ8_9EUKA|nr:hypothetical protein PROFUN_15431 [Planoprotostelium fungivorum]